MLFTKFHEKPVIFNTYYMRREEVCGHENTIGLLRAGLNEASREARQVNK